MFIYSHTNYTLKGYTWLTHEPIILGKNEITEVPEEVGIHLLGTHPLQFCRVESSGQAEAHRGVCPLYHGPDQGPGLEEQVTYANRRMGRPPRDRMMRTA